MALITIADAAEKFGVSTQTIKKVMSDNGIDKKKKPGDRKHYVDEDCLAKHLEFKSVE